MYNSDGYILIDMSEADITKTNQYIKGIYQRIVNVIDTNKLVLVINAGDLTPMAAVVTKTFNYYVITTQAYIFTINSNDIVIIEQAGEASVDVAIVPTLLDGVKIADYQVGVVSGSIYAPEQQSEINDNTTSTLTTWSSDKINTQLSAKANASDLATVATTGAYADLSGTPTVPTKTSQLENDSGFITSAQVPTIDDNAVASDKVWSSYKTSAELGNKANSADVYTKSEVDTALSSKQNSTDNSLTTTNKTVVGAINEIESYITTVSEITATFDSTKINSGGINAYKMGKLVYVSGYMQSNAGFVAGVKFGSISAKPISQVFVSPVGSNGQGTRIRLTYNNGDLESEAAVVAGVWYSFSFMYIST